MPKSRYLVGISAVKLELESPPVKSVLKGSEFMTPLVKWANAFAGTTVAILACIEFVDRPVALLFQKTVTRPDALTTFTHAPDPLLPLAAAVFLGLGFWSLSGRILSRAQNCVMLSSISLMIADIMKEELKLAFGRTWPDTWLGNNPSFLRDGVYGFHFFHGGRAYASFPSGHMAVTCAVLSVLWFFYPAWRTVYVIVGVPVAAGLVGANYHFVSDVIAGSFVGISIGWMLTSVWNATGHRT